MIPAIDKSLKDRKELIDQGYWTEYEAQYNLVSRSYVRLSYGYIHSNGMHERAIATREYFEDGSFTVSVHV
jgi:hypothetical protein